MHATTRRATRRRGTVALLAGLALAATTVGLPGPASAGLRSATALPAAVLPAAAAAQVVTSDACTGSAPTTCTLHAAEGTVTLPTGTAPVWGFTGPGAGPVTAPGGPALVVTAGSQVTVELHNDLTDPLALAFPGVGGLTDDLTGAAPGATRSYTFTAPAPGTYVYEAGHTDLGPRQVAMGLAGVMVVRPAGFDAGAPTQDGTAATAYDDEAVLALSEIDPAFNAAPRTFDLRKFHPQYRLINGAMAPNIPPVATAHGRTVLLRYANLGLLGHAMGVLGTKQQVLAIDGNADIGRVALVSDMIAPGQTEDTRVAYPVGGPSRLPVYETAGSLDNAGRPAATGSLVVGFGGMLTFLDTGATGGGADTVGPTVSAAAVSPSPVPSPLTPATVTATASDVASGGANISQAEMWVDAANAPNFGGGTPMTVTTPTSPTSQVTGTLTQALLATLGQGQHRVYLRAMDSNNNWGPVTSAQFTLAVTGATTSALSLTPNPTNGSRAVTVSATGDDSAIGGSVTAAEYFVDTLGANGTGTPMVLGAGTTVRSETATIAAAQVFALTEGAHKIWVHTLDSANLWGPAVSLDLKLDRTAPTMSAGAVTPNPTDGTVGDPVDPTALKVHASFVDPTSNGISSPIAGAEGFLDQAGADGTGFVFVADDGAWDTASESGYGLIPLSQLTGLANGTHTALVHARDAAGNWGGTVAITFTLQRGPAVLFSDYFESGTLAAWTGGTSGTVANIASNAIDGSRLFRATGSNAYLVSPTFSPASTTLKAEVKLSPQTLVTGTGWVTVLEARSGSTTVAAIQYHRQSSTGARQVRLQVRSGTTTRTSNTVTISNTAVTTLRLDWSAGSARTDTLSINGTVAQSLTNVNGSGQAVSTVRLGVVGTATSGQLYLDSFIATH